MPRKSKAPAAPVPTKRGRPAHEPTEKDRKTVAVMVAGGILHQAIAGVLGISVSSLERHYRTELDNGAATMSLRVLSAHVDRIDAGDMRAIEWWEKSRMGWSEKMIVEAPLPMRVIVELVGDAAPAAAAGPAKPRTLSGSAVDVEFVG